MKCAGSEVAYLVSVFTTLIVIYKAEQEKFLIRDVEKSEKSAREPQLGYAILEKFSLFLVSLLLSPLVSKRKRSEA